MNTPEKSLWSRANTAFRNKEFESAVTLYEEAIRQADAQLIPRIRFNLLLASVRMQASKTGNDVGLLESLLERTKLDAEISAIRPYFNCEFYLNVNSDVNQLGVDPVEHYCRNGWKEGRDPHPEFITKWYCETNFDVMERSMNPFFHWVRFGKQEGRPGRPEKTAENAIIIAQPRIFDQAAPFQPIADPVDIIVPVFNAFDDLRECLDRLDRNTPPIHRIILIDDASTDIRVALLLQSFSKTRPSTHLICQAVNQGFIASVNRGFKEAKGNVVLLNTDAFVPNNWLERLIDPILADISVATVTPMTNNGEIANVPVMCNPESLATGVADLIDNVARQFDSRNALAIAPTGVGFCMAMSRHWLKMVPNFDTVFGRGYGEEVDWCQKVRELGGQHILTGALFVEHRGGMSFGPEKQDRISKSSKLITQRYPTYDASVQSFVRNDPIFGPRIALGLALISCEGVVPIYLGHRLGGGAELWLEDRIQKHIAQSKSAVVVRDGDAPNTALIELHRKTGVIKGNLLVSELVDYFKLLPEKELIYSCLVAAKKPFEIINALIKSLNHNNKLRMLFHDYFMLCPSHTLLNYNNEYCELPAQKKCEECYRKLPRTDTDMPPTIKSWRDLWHEKLDLAHEVEVFSNSSRDLVKKIWPGLSEKIVVKPHQPKIPLKQLKKPDNQKPVIGVLGSIGFHKGARVLHDLAELAGDLLSIVIIGEIDPAFAHNRMIVHGRYERDQIADLAKKYKIDRWLHSSIIPETFSYTIRECLATGLPVYAFNIGGQADALRGHPRGILIPLSTSMKILVDKLLKTPSRNQPRPE